MDSARCTFCRTPSPLLFRVSDLNRKLSAEVFFYYRCPSCALIFLQPHPADLGKYYPQAYYGNTLTLEDLEPEFPFNRYKVDIVRQFVQTGRLLEVGPSRGTFAYLAKESGFQVGVIERDQECCRFLRETVGIDTLPSTDPTTAMQQEAPCDVIALWQVIEHLNDPWEFVRAAAGKLKPGGILILATPNPDSWQFKMFGRNWFHLDAPRHLQLIPAKLLTGLGAALGLHQVMLTAADADSRRHNVAGWQSSVENVFPVARLRAFIHRHVGSMAQRLQPYEQGDFRGCTYTLVLQKPA